MKQLLFVLSLLLGSLFLRGQQCDVTDPRFSPGEKVTYDVYYHLGFMWLSAGWVNFNTTLETYKEKPALHFKSFGKSYPKWDWIYEVDDTYESFVSPVNLTPYYFSRDVNENSLEHKEFYEFSPEKKSIAIRAKKNKDPWVEKQVKMDRCMFDPITMIYYARCIPFNQYKKDDKIPLTMAIDGEVHEVFLRYLGSENKAVKNKGTYKALKFSAMLVEGTIFKGGEGMTVWVTDDKNRVPLVIESEVLVGEILVIANEMDGLKYPITSKISDEY